MKFFSFFISSLVFIVSIGCTQQESVESVYPKCIAAADRLSQKEKNSLTKSVGKAVYTQLCDVMKEECAQAPDGAKCKDLIRKAGKLSKTR